METMRGERHMNRKRDSIKYKIKSVRDRYFTFTTGMSNVLSKRDGVCVWGGGVRKRDRDWWRDCIS